MKEKEPCEILRDLLEKKVQEAREGGSDRRVWNEGIDITLSGSDLYWLLNVAQAGIDARKEEWSKAPGGLDASSLCSLCDFSMTLQKVVEQATVALNATPRKKKGGGK